MECQVRSMASSSLTEDVNIPEGRVEAVCKQWLVREDGVLAYKLQSEEIEHHYGHNKERSQLIRSDLEEARREQKTEEDEAAAMHMAYEKMLKDQEDHDAYIAQQLQEKLLREELEQEKRIEEEDQRIALELQKKEKLRLQRKREEWEMRQAEKARVELSGASNSSSVKSMEDVLASREAATSPLDKNFSLLSLEPPDNLTAEEFQEFVALRDAELARILQEQESQPSSESKDDRQLAIEAQDRELAKVLQEQERARARKARERARQKAALAQQQENNTSIPETSSGSIDRALNVKERVKSPEWSSLDRRNYVPDFSGVPVTNVAAELDPTFTPSPSTSSSLGSLRLSSPITLLSSPTKDTLPYISSAIGREFYPHNSEDAAPPYMPIQGTRRTTSSLEKTKKSKKDSCKQQ